MLLILPSSIANWDPVIEITFFNPKITNENITINGITNKVFTKVLRKIRCGLKLKNYF